MIELPTPDGDDETARTNDSSVAIESIACEEEDPDEYTFVPADASGFDLMTTWITADSDTVVDLKEQR